MPRGRSVSIHEAVCITDEYMWEHARRCAAENLSKRSKDQKLNVVAKLLCRPRTSSDINRIEERKAKCLSLSDSSQLMIGARETEYQNRKLAVSERDTLEREMVFETLKCYRQINVLKQHDML